MPTNDEPPAELIQRLKTELAARDLTSIAFSEHQSADVTYRKVLRDTFIEQNKFAFEAMKHLTTLSAGSILLMVTFLEKLFANNRKWSGLIGTALVCFMISIISAVSSLIQTSGLLTAWTIGHKDSTFRQRLKQGIQTLAFLSFVVGIVCLSLLALKNLYI